MFTNSQLWNSNFKIFQRCRQKYSRSFFSTKSRQLHSKPKQVESSEESVDQGPVKYSSSPANLYRASFTRGGQDLEPRLWYEPHVISVCIVIFLVYFTILREENDIDEELGRTLYSRIDGLEEHQLTLSLQYNIEHGKDSTDIVNRLKEIDMQKKKQSEHNTE